MGPAPCTNGLFIVLLLVLAAADFGSGQQNPYTTKFSPSRATVIIVLIVILIAFFFLFFLCLFLDCIHHCYGHNSYSATRLPIGAAAARPRRQQRGLDPAVLETFPTMAYADVKEHKAVKGALECAVCLSEFDDDETLRLLPKCSHVFHPDCIDTWLASHVTCPVCRANLVPNDTDFPATGDELSSVHPASQPPQEVPPPDSATEAAPTVVIDVEESEDERIIREETDELARIGSLKRALRSKSNRAPTHFSRSHSTGHSLAAPASICTGAGIERFTLRLPKPEHADRLRRMKSLVAFTAGRQGSTYRSLRLCGDGSSRSGTSVRLGQSGRWPSFLSRTFSAAWGARSTRSAELGGSSKGGKPAGAGGKSVECKDH
ncbi:E3 ubiquitin-protein ligase ATL6-like [Triticum dicoccoides]|uniref:E3 ubiquitin-protein ligase ATL6-like n=1 Tax=Triticum dicoccoides TaxID=85692 RepID=UPI00188EB14A|nr:E3 ubiquitin-protein ligase ATL6-like [Triticum dicoccoides]